MKHLAEGYVPVVISPRPADVFCYSPGLAILPSGRLIATMDFGGPGVAEMPGAIRLSRTDRFCFLGKIFYSDDRGATWQEAATLPLMHMRPFALGNALYAIGHNGDLGIARSDDEGRTWSRVCPLTSGERWHQAPCNVWYKGDCAYLVMERFTNQRHGWPVCGIAPVLLRAREGLDLTRRENWTFASELVYDRHVDEEALVDWGIPFYPEVRDGYMSGTPTGWLETNVVQLLKPDDWFFDPTGHTLHLFMRTWTGLAWTGAMAKVVEREDGSMETMFERAPSGRRMVFTHIPGGGQSKFHMLYDPQTRTYWLLSNQFCDSMVNFNQMTVNERRGYDRSRLVLHYSYNCFDWLFAGVVATGGDRNRARSYASMVIDGDDLLVLSRTGEERALNGHDTNVISFHRVEDFRALIDA